jgi:hypothetical protein
MGITENIDAGNFTFLRCMEQHHKDTTKIQKIQTYEKEKFQPHRRIKRPV